MEIDIVACAGKFAIPTFPGGFNGLALPNGYNLEGDEIHDIGGDQDVNAISEALTWKYSNIEEEN